MKLSKREQIATLAGFKSDRFLTTSFYLDTDRSRLRKKQIQVSVKNLLNQNKAFLEKPNLGKAKRESLALDLEKISAFCEEHLDSHHHPGLAVFSCSKEHFWETFELPGSPRNRVVFDQNPYIRPLSAILNEYSRICVLALDRKEARWFDVSMGEIVPLRHLVGDVPSRVREGGWEGYESKRIERHIANHLRGFLKKVSRVTFDLFRELPFDWLFLAGNDTSCVEFEALLHPYVKERLKTRMKSKPGDPPGKILKEALLLESKVKDREEKETLRRFVDELRSGGLAISGLGSTLNSLNRGEVQVLLVTRHFSKPGMACPMCGFLFATEIQCPSCRRKTESVLDVIDEAVEAALDKKSKVIHIDPPSSLSKYGNIGAILRYKA